jgi:hypothetical protein
MNSEPILLEQIVPANTRTSDLLEFLAKLRCGPQIPEGDIEGKEPNQERWLGYYGACLQYISSLHNQFIATLSIQGALAIGCLAAIHSVAEAPRGKLIAPTLGVLGLLMELALTFIAIKLFRQHCVTCWMLARIERERLALPNWASMKQLLGTKGNRLFTSPSTLVLTVIYGLALGAGLAVGSFVGL